MHERIGTILLEICHRHSMLASAITEVRSRDRVPLVGEGHQLGYFLGA